MDNVLKNRVAWFKDTINKDGHATFNEFMRATLAVFPYCEVKQDAEGQLVINTGLDYRENDKGQLIVAPLEIPTATKP